MGRGSGISGMVIGVMLGDGCDAGGNGDRKRERWAKDGCEKEWEDGLRENWTKNEK